MSGETVGKMIKRRTREAKLPAGISAHSLRGTRICEALRNGHRTNERLGSDQ